MSDVRRRPSQALRPELASPVHPSSAPDLRVPGAGAQTPPRPPRVQRPSRHRRCSRIGSAYPCSRPDLAPPSGRMGDDGRTCFTVTTRFTIS
jgi:hypothetical protein